MTFAFSHSTYSIFAMLLLTAIFEAMASSATFIAWFLKCGFLWKAISIVFTVVIQVSLLVLAGQHIPILENVALNGYCFGEPSLLYYFLLVLPLLAVPTSIVFAKYCVRNEQ
jgi:hypothetical protein